MARLTVTGLASRMAYSYDEIEDLRIAVGEVCGILFDAGADPSEQGDPGEQGPSSDPTDRVEVICTVTEEALQVRTTRSAAHRTFEVTDLNRQILESVTDGVEFDLEPGSPSVTFTKQRRP